MREDPPLLDVQQLVNFYNLQPHPEGGYYKETYWCAERVNANALPARFAGERSFSTAIYFLLTGENYSAFHRIKSDELWHFYAGSPLNIYVLSQAGELNIIMLGNNILQGQTFQATVPAGCWFASKCSQASGFSFVGCTVAPGFDFADFDLANASDLSADFPAHKPLINTLCR